MLMQFMQGSVLDCAHWPAQSFFSFSLIVIEKMTSSAVSRQLSSSKVALLDVSLA